MRVARIIGCASSEQEVALRRRRVAMRGLGGLGFLLDLPESTVLDDGDALILEDDRRFRKVEEEAEAAEAPHGDAAPVPVAVIENDAGAADGAALLPVLRTRIR
jgi:hypothetical protein